MKKKFTSKARYFGLKLTIVLFTLLLIGGQGWGQSLLVENFDYTIGSVITATATPDPITGWQAHSGNNTANIDVTSGLTFSGYAGSGVGGAANLDATGQDINKPFAAQTTGVVYVASIIKIDANTTAGYFFHLGPNVIGTTFFSRIWVNGTANGINITTGNTAPASYLPITTGTPFLLVLKHDFVSNTTKMYILNSFSATEPVAADATITETMTEIGSVALRQYNASQRVIVDGIRVGNTWADAVAPSTSNATATPTLSPSGGNFFSIQNVVISCTTVGSTIYYTTDGTDPSTTNGTEYTIPIQVSTTTTIKARAYATGYDPSSIATSVYTFPTINDVANIAALRAGLTDGTVYRLTGEAILTYKSANNNVKYIQDGTGAIMIFDAAGKITTAYNQNEGITGIMGTLTLYNNMLEFVPVLDPGAATSTGNTVTPVTVTLANLTTAYQAMLVKVVNTTISGTGNFAASTNYTITDPGSSGVLRTAYTDLNYIGQPIPLIPQDITGVVLQFNTTMQLVPRNQNDFADYVPLVPTIYSSPSALSGFSYVFGNGPSNEDSFIASGSNLSADISITLPTITDYEISTGNGASFVATNPIVLTQSGGIVNATTINVRLKAGLTVGSYNGEVITISSTGAADQTVTCSGDVILETPIATTATDVTSSGFTAHWNAVPGATGYYIDVYHSGSSLNATELLISEYVEGLSSEKYVEVFNGTTAPIDLSDYKLQLFTNGSATASQDIALTGSLASGETIVYKNSSATLYPAGINNGAVNFNGDDALALYKISTLNYVDIFGRIGDDPGTAWTSASNTTLDKTLRRKSNVTSGITISPTGTGPTAFTTLETEWDQFDVNTVAGLGTHTLGTGIIYDLTDQSVGNVTAYPVGSLSSNTTYYYVVRASAGTTTSPNSNVIDVTTLVGLSAPVVSSPTATSVTVNSSILGGDITSDGGSAITERGTVWNTIPGVTISDNMLAEGGTSTGVFSHLRTSLPSGTEIFYRAYATNAIGTTLSEESSFFTLAPEPSNHATNFTAGTATAASIPLTWTDATGTVLPAAYLIKGSAVSYADIAAPVDGTPEANATLVQNVNYGQEIYTFTGLNPETQYFFRIFPYTNSGAAIDYKTDGTVPEATATTEAVILPLAAWTFDATPAAPNTPNAVAANYGTLSGTAMLYADGTNGSSSWVTATTGNELTAFGGTTTNDPREPAISGNAYTVVGGTATSANGKSMVIKFSMTGYENPVLTYATRYSSSSGFTSQIWAYSTDGTNFTDFGSNLAPTSTTFAVKSLDLSTVDALDQAATVYLRVTFDGATGATANNRLDNIVLRATEAPQTKTLNAKLFLEGLYDAGTGLMRQAQGLTGPQFGTGIADQVSIELHNATTPFDVVYTFNNIDVNTDGTLSISTLPGTITGSYYIVVKHHNSIETWSGVPVDFGVVSPLSYDFSTAASQAYGNNLKLMGSIYAIWGADAFPDGIVDGSDMLLIDNASKPPALQGYNVEDVNGDGIVDGSDMLMIDNNSKPPAAQVQRP